MLKIHPIKAFQDNYIWCIENSTTQECIVVDPGDSTPVTDYLNQNNLTLAGILITHHHFDHTGGIESLTTKKSAAVYGPNNPKIKSITHPLKNNDQITLLGTDFIIKEVPGHTLDHIAFYSEKDSTHSTPWLFCGDTLFSAGCGRLFEGTPSQMLESLKTLAAFPPETDVYCTHEYTLTNLSFAKAVLPGNEQVNVYIKQCQEKIEEGRATIPTTIKTEQAINPFLNCTKTELVHSVCNHSNLADTSELAVFTALRSWKDNF